MELLDRDDELEAALAEVDRFARRALAPRAERPERPMAAGELAALLTEAGGFGLLPGDEPGLALWDDAAARPLRSVHALVRLARAHAGAGLALHQRALAHQVARRLGLPGADALVVHGRFGLARTALPRLLAGAALDADERALLADVYGVDAPRLITTGPFTRVLIASVDGDAVRWHLHERGALAVELADQPHGFDDLTTAWLRPRPGGVRRAAEVAAPEAAAALGAALGLASLGQLAIALGAAQRAHDLARRFAAVRQQGGAPIDRHAAVQLLLASSRGALATVEAQLADLARRPMTTATLARVLAVRAEAHPLLCRAGNDALQVFGGVGYMRDTGVEQVVRDLNHLRVTLGSPPELGLFVAEWERLHA